MEYNAIIVNNYINILSNQQLMSLFSQEEILKMQIYVKRAISNELKNQSLDEMNSVYEQTQNLFK